MNTRFRKTRTLDGWDLDGIQFFPSLRKLVIKGRVVRLPPKPARVLEMLTRAAPNPATKEELLDEIWARSFTGDSVVADAVKYLRRATNGDGHRPLIETLHKLGYRLAVTPVAIVARESAASGPGQGDSGYLAGSRSKVLLRFGYGLPLALLTIGAVFAVKNQAGELDQAQHDSGQQTQVSNHQPPGPTEADIHYVRGVQHYQRYRSEDNQIAISQFGMALKLDPNYVRAYAGMSNAYSMQAIKFGGDSSWVDRAEALARQAIALKPSDASGYKAMGVAMGYYGRLRDAASSYEQALLLFPDYVPAMTNLGIIRIHQGRLDESIPLFTRALQLAPGAIIERLQMGRAYRLLGMDDLARAWYEKGIALAPGATADGMAAVEFLLTRGEIERARNLLGEQTESLALDPHLGFWRGMTDHYAGDNESAVSHFQLTMAVTPADSLLWLQSNVRQQLATMQQGGQADHGVLYEVETSVERFMSEGAEDPVYAELLAQIAVARDDRQGAIDLLQLAFEQGWLAIDEFEADPAYVSIRNAPGAGLLKQQMLDRRSDLISSFSMRHSNISVASISH